MTSPSAAAAVAAVAAADAAAVAADADGAHEAGRRLPVGFDIWPPLRIIEILFSRSQGAGLFHSFKRYHLGSMPASFCVQVDAPGR